MAGEALTIARGWIERWNAGDLAPVYETFDPDIVVRPDPDWPDGVFFGRDAAQRFWESNREAMGAEPMEIEEEHDLGERCLVRVHQPVHSRSGIESAYSWSYIVTVREGKVILVEFFIDEKRGLAALGL